MSTFLIFCACAQTSLLRNTVKKYSDIWCFRRSRLFISVVTMAEIRKMDLYFSLCSSFSVPLWVAPLLHAASRLKGDPARRRKAYRLIQRRLLHHGVGCGKLNKPTYVYPAEVKQLIRAAFPEDICDYHDPQHQNVVAVTMDDLNGVNALDQSC